jgi:hypothetical protein
MGFGAATAVRSLKHGILLAGALASVVVFFLSLWMVFFSTTGL